MKQLLRICAGILLALTAGLGAFLFFYDYEYHKIRPLCGEWHSTLDDTRLKIELIGDTFLLTLTRDDAEREHDRSEIHIMRYKECIYYTAYDGRRVDLFYTPPADALLLVPGGAFKRILKYKNNEQ